MFLFFIFLLQEMIDRFGISRVRKVVSKKLEEANQEPRVTWVDFPMPEVDPNISIEDGIRRIGYDGYVIFGKEVSEEEFLQCVRESKEVA